MGYMGLENPVTEVDRHTKFSEIGQKGSWAVGHEFGHNMQWLTGFQHSKYGETTNNFWALYIYEKVNLRLCYK